MDIGKTGSVLLFSLLTLSFQGGPSGPALSDGKNAFAAAGDVSPRADNTIGIAIDTEKGKEFSFVLESNRTTGYQWRLARPLDERLVRFVRSEYAPPQSGLIGAGGEETWVFLATGEGETEILMDYVRPWEKGGPPAKTAGIRVSIKAAPGK